MESRGDAAAGANIERKQMEVEAWHFISDALRRLDSDAQARVLRSIIALFDIPLNQLPTTPTHNPIQIIDNPPFSGADERTLSPKEFLYDKRPATDIDKIACLAYYLSHYKNTPHFKTLDLSQLNTEAAQVKFSNAAQAVENATKAGLLVPAVKGQKQLSAFGEMYVQALPDRDAARAAIEGHRRKRAKRSVQGKASVEAYE